MWEILNKSDNEIIDFVKTHPISLLVQEDDNANTMFMAALEQKKTLAVLKSIILKDPQQVLKGCLGTIITEANIAVLKWIFDEKFPITEKIPPFINSFSTLAAAEKRTTKNVERIEALSAIKQFLLETTLNNDDLLVGTINYAIQKKKDLFNNCPAFKEAAQNYASRTKNAELMQALEAPNPTSSNNSSPASSPSSTPPKPSPLSSAPSTPPSPVPEQKQVNASSCAANLLETLKKRNALQHAHLDTQNSLLQQGIGCNTANR